MRKKFVLWAAIIAAPLCAAPNQGYYYPDQQSVALREIRDSLETVKHSVNNQETEIRTFEEKLANLDTIIESVRDQINDSSQSHKDQLKGSSAALDTKLAAIDTTVKGILTDLKQFQSYTSESTTTLAQYKKKITDLEKTIELQNQSIDDMQAAIKALMDALQVKSAAMKPVPTITATGSEIVYKVKKGDSLEKIAKAHGTTVKAIKDVNNLANDKIFVGKNLKIPQS